MQPAPPQPAQNGRTAGRVLGTLVLTVVAAILIDTWLVDGWYRATVIASGSMAPSLGGPRRVWQCAGCGQPIACDSRSLPARGAAVICPECGGANDFETGIDLAGDRVLIDRSAFLCDAPRRWEMVVCRNPDDPTAMVVKRVVGLAGESVQIIDGDVIIDGKIARKTLDEQRTMAVNVYSVPTPVSAGAVPTIRWQGGTEWRCANGRFSHPGADEVVATSVSGDAAPIDWLEYRHPTHFRSEQVATDGPILDDSPSDQAESRPLNAVRDAIIRCNVRGQGTIQLRADCGDDRFAAGWNLATGASNLLHNGRRAVTVSGAARATGRETTVEWVLADQQAILALDGRVVAAYPYERRLGAPASPIGHLALGAQRGDAIEISRLQILRDVYYTPGPVGPADAMYRLGPDEYLLLGDNSPHSIDSRSWSPPGVHVEQLVGRVLAW